VSSADQSETTDCRRCTTSLAAMRLIRKDDAWSFADPKADRLP
jgi:hypothetical protein